ncbi:uncharacterized protein [Macrobrachium rosenbergii]|uniref:uncharacterized protein n=1 Tax=Macrobrachium rosenbergii TaxID=79674 RepID=UPI0034D5A4E8
MERALRPERLDILPTSPDAARVFKHWLFIFSRYKNATEGTNDVYLGMLANALSPDNFELISDCSTYDDAIAKLNKVFIQPANEIVSRHRLATRRQMSGETIDEYLRALHKLSVDCNFKDVSSEDSQSYGIPSDECIPAAAVNSRPEYDDHAPVCEKADRSDAPDDDLVALTLQEKCFFCGYRRHPRKKCPAKEVNCRKCNKLVHFAKVCLSKSKPTSAASSFAAALASVPSTLNHSVFPIFMRGTKVNALIDTGSSENFISDNILKNMKLPATPYSGTISMAASHYVSPISGSCNVDIVVNGREVFRNLSPDCHPIAVKSRRYSASDAEFIRTEIDRLLEEGVIEHSTSPWRAQVVVVHNRNKRRMVVDYSETINKFTYLDAYPLPNIDDLVNEIAKYKVFSSVDLKSAYHLVPLPEEDRPYTAFEADSGLYQFTRLCFGLTNGVAAFQRIINDIIRTNGLKGVYAYLDDVVVCGNTQEEHDENL